jgi:glutathione S-transferase
MKIYSFAWGMYPRRVIIYLAEKGISNIDLVQIDVLAGENREPEHLARNPAGTVPVLETGNGAFIQTSTAILEYFEELYPTPNMIGETPFERARTRDMMSRVNETYIHLSHYWAHASPLFSQRFEQKVEAADAAYAFYTKQLDLIEQSMAEGPFLCGSQATIADCAMFGAAQFADRLYGEPLTDRVPRLKQWYEMFAGRPSATVPEYPAVVAELAPPAGAAA